VPPMLALAEALVGGGHEVTVLSQPSVRRRAEHLGCSFVPFSQLGDYEQRTPLEEQVALALPMIAGGVIGHDLLRAADAVMPDLVVVDANLSGGLAAAEALGQPSVVLLHSMYKTFVDTWFADLWPLLEAPINETRTSFGVDAVDSWPSLFARHDLLLSVVPRAFDAPVADTPASMRHFGFLVPRSTPPAPGPVTFPHGAGPRVLVGLSTTYQGQERLLQTILDALARREVRGVVTTAGQVDRGRLVVPPQVVVADFVAHRRLLPQADAMVTHAGLGTVAAALSFGVPLVCTPVSRDQPLNAQRVEGAGAGIACPVGATTEQVVSALERLLSDSRYREHASALAAASRAEGGAPAAAEALLRRLG
jgi:MGT family glycosyltransferase